MSSYFKVGRVFLGCLFQMACFSLKKWLYAQCFLEVNIEGRPGALNLCAPIVTLPEHFGEGLTHGRKYVEDKVENAGQPWGPCVCNHVCPCSAHHCFLNLVLFSSCTMWLVGS